MTFFELKIVKCIVSLVSHNSESLIQVKSHRNAPIPKPISIVVWFLPLTLNFNLGPLGNIVTKNKAMLSMFWLLNCLTCTVEKKKHSCTRAFHLLFYTYRFWDCSASLSIKSLFLFRCPQLSTKEERFFFVNSEIKTLHETFLNYYL